LGQIFYQVSLLKYIFTLEFDVWLESFTPPFTVSFLPLLTSKPVIGITHFMSAAEKSKEYHLPFHLVESFGLKWYKFFIAMTQELKTKILRSNRNAFVEIIPNGSNLVRLKSLEKEKKYFLFLGRLEIYQKGIDLLLKAFRDASKSMSVNLLIAGTGSKKELRFIKGRINSYELNERVKLLGFIKGKRKIDLLQNSIALLLPSRYESQSLTVLESISLGTPIISFDIRGLSWLSRSTGIRVKTGNLKGLAESIERMSNNKKLREKYSKASLKEAKKYNWRTITNQYQKFIAQVLA
jgi:glycosyltransferase involved in cell wall biosynthesis